MPESDDGDDQSAVVDRIDASRPFGFLQTGGRGSSSGQHMLFDAD
jgi:hypothetical protein